MSEYIITSDQLDAWRDAIVDSIKEQVESYVSFTPVTLTVEYPNPTICVLGEIVRCKDCKHLDRKDYTKTHKVPITGSWCNWFADTCEQDGYCKWGEVA